MANQIRPSCSPRSRISTTWGCEREASTRALPPEPLHEGRVGGEVLGEDLQGDLAPPRAVLRLVDAAHAPPSDETGELPRLRASVRRARRSDRAAPPCGLRPSACGQRSRGPGARTRRGSGCRPRPRPPGARSPGASRPDSGWSTPRRWMRLLGPWVLPPACPTGEQAPCRRDGAKTCRLGTRARARGYDDGPQRGHSWGPAAVERIVRPRLNETFSRPGRALPPPPGRTRGSCG